MYSLTGVISTAEGAVVFLEIPLYHLCPALQFMDKAVRGLEFSVELWKSADGINTVNKTAIVASPNNVQPRLDWYISTADNGVELMMQRIVPTSTYNLILQEKLNKGIDILTKFSSPNIYRFGVERNQTSFDQHIITTASRPLFAQVIFQFRRNTDGANNLTVGANNSFYATDEFEHAYVSSLACYVNGLKVPQEGINQSISETKVYGVNNDNPFPYVDKENIVNVSNAYYWYLRNIGNFRAPYLKNFQDSLGILGLKDWKNKLPVYTFDLSLNSVASWSGGSSQINIRGTRENTDGAPYNAPDDYYMFVQLWTEQSLGIHLENFNNYTTIT